MKYFELPDDLMLPTIEEIVDIHDEQLVLYGGMVGQSPERFTGVDATLGRVWAHVNYSENPDLLSAIAILWHGLNQAHAFLDANKRTALMTMATRGATCANSTDRHATVALMAPYGAHRGSCDDFWMGACLRFAYARLKSRFDQSRRGCCGCRICVMYSKFCEFETLLCFVLFRSLFETRFGALRLPGSWSLHQSHS